MFSIPDDTRISTAERTGYAHWHSNWEPICPVCGAVCETVYKADGEIVGCDECLTQVDAWEALRDD